MSYAYVGQASIQSSSGGVASEALTYAPVAGNAIFVAVGYSAGSATAMIASGSHGLQDQSGNDLPYVECGTGYHNAGSGYGQHFLFVPNIRSGVTSITAAVASAVNPLGVGVAEYSGLAATVDGQAHNDAQTAASTGADVVTSTTITPTGATGGAILIGFCGGYSAFETAVAGTGFTARPSGGAGWLIGSQGGVADKRITSNTAVAATFTANTSGHVYSTYAFVVDEAGGAPSILLTQLERGTRGFNRGVMRGLA